MCWENPMRVHPESSLRKSRLRSLVACLALALGTDLSASTMQAVDFSRGGANAPSNNKPFKTSPESPTSTFMVKNCDDAGADSLRDAIDAANVLGSDATIQFDTSAMMGCSTITLSTGEIDIGLDNLTIA